MMILLCHHLHETHTNTHTHTLLISCWHPLARCYSRHLLFPKIGFGGGEGGWLTSRQVLDERFVIVVVVIYMLIYIYMGTIINGNKCATDKIPAAKVAEAVTRNHRKIRDTKFFIHDQNVNVYIVIKIIIIIIIIMSVVASCARCILFIDENEHINTDTHT